MATKGVPHPAVSGKPWMVSGAIQPEVAVHALSKAEVEGLALELRHEQQRDANASASEPFYPVLPLVLFAFERSPDFASVHK
jgi:hypothetical protein